jgi:uncharacterized membrane-anchored protein YjiN (DUF445 family)
MQRLALGLLAGAALLYALAIGLEPRHAAWGYVAAFAELPWSANADWFAVVALFRPAGPVHSPPPSSRRTEPHRREPGDFMATHFLSTEQVLARVRLRPPAAWPAGCQPANAARVGGGRAARWPRRWPTSACCS